ncbi:MAG: NUDIX hydrolase [Clostridia bacterium]|nr:NUDIX hydrolase [Clostridia bacterium]
MNLEEKTIKSEERYKGRIMGLLVDTVTLPDGQTATREIVTHNGGVGVIAEDNEGNIYLVNQYRYPYHRVTLEIPAGKRDSLDEEPIVCGKRELKEETGATAKNFIPLGSLYPTPGYCAEIIWLFAATDLEFGSQNLDSDEFLNVKKIPFKKALEMVLNDEIKDSKTQIAILKYNEYKKANGLN